MHKENTVETVCVLCSLMNELFEYRSSGDFETLLNNRFLLKSFIFVKKYDIFRQKPFYIKIS